MTRFDDFPKHVENSEVTLLQLGSLPQQHLVIGAIKIMLGERKGSQIRGENLLAVQSN